MSEMPRTICGMALNSKQEIFVKEYLVDQNATRAAKAAGYSDRTSGKIGSENLAKPEIKRAIEIELKKRQRELELAALKKGMSKERWIEELCIIAGANIDDFVTIDGQSVKNGASGKSYQVVSAAPVLTKDRPRDLGRAIKKISETKNGIGIELHSKQAALELLARAFGWIKNDLDLNIPEGGVQVVLTMPKNGREAKPTEGDANEETAVVANNREITSRETQSEGLKPGSDR